MGIFESVKAVVFRHHRFAIKKINELRDVVIKEQLLVLEMHRAAQRARAKESQGGGQRPVVYTVVISAYDVLVLHSFISPDWDYVCFTDSESLLSLGFYGVWNVKPLHHREKSDALTNRWHKTHPHILFPQRERSIYVDANIDIKTDFLFAQIERRKESPLLITAHSLRFCIYEEIKICRKKKKETRENTEKIRQMLKNAGFPKNYGLTENCIVYRRHNDRDIISLMEEWWTILSEVSHRDQLSLSFLLWKRGISVSDIALPNARFDGRNFYFHAHLPKYTPAR